MRGLAFITCLLSFNVPFNSMLVVAQEHAVDAQAEKIHANRMKAHEIHAAALTLAQAGKVQDAMPGFKEATELDPTVGVYFANLGVSQMQGGLLDEALVNLKKAEVIDPNADGLQGTISNFPQNVFLKQHELCPL